MPILKFWDADTARVPRCLDYKRSPEPCSGRWSEVTHLPVKLAGQGVAMGEALGVNAAQCQGP